MFDQLAAGGLLGAVPRGDVGDFVSHHAGQLSFVIGFQKQAGIDEEEPARQGKCVHFFRIQHLDGEGDLGVGVPHQILAHAVDVLRDDRVVDDLALALHFLGQLFAEGDFFLQRVEVHALADIAVSDGVRVLFLVLIFVPSESAGSQQAQRNPNCHR